MLNMSGSGRCHCQTTRRHIFDGRRGDAASRFEARCTDARLSRQLLWREQLDACPAPRTTASGAFGLSLSSRHRHRSFSPASAQLTH